MGTMIFCVLGSIIVFVVGGIFLEDRTIGLGIFCLVNGLISLTLGLIMSYLIGKEYYEVRIPNCVELVQQYEIDQLEIKLEELKSER